MSTQAIERSEVIELSKSLPGFPIVISQILATIDDPEANLNKLIDFVESDPVITSRLISLANTMAFRTRNATEVRDVHMATALVGTTSLRNIAITSSFAKFCEQLPYSHRDFLRHSIAVAVCCEELVEHTEIHVPAEAALVAGLLHDIGQLWLWCFKRELFSEIWDMARSGSLAIEQVERDTLGIDHSTIGAWIAEQWHLPASIVEAIGHHHKPDPAHNHQLTALTHVAEVLCNALELDGYGAPRVTQMSRRACDCIGIKWNSGSRELFGRIEARSRYACSLIDR